MDLYKFDQTSRRALASRSNQTFWLASIYNQLKISARHSTMDAASDTVEVTPLPTPAPAELFPQPAKICSPPAEPKPASKPKKRGRAMGPPISEILYAQNGRKLSVRIEVPDPGEECALTLSPMAEDSLEFLQPTTTYFTSFPQAKKMVLPCGHAFGVLNILYHFARRNMLCPCCRAGLDARLSSHCVPGSFRKTFLSKIQQEIQQDSQELDESDRRAAATIALAEADYPVVFVGFRNNMMPASLAALFEVQVSLGVSFVNYNESRPPVFMLSFPMRTSIHPSRPDCNVFTLREGRRMFEECLRDPSVSGMDLKVFLEHGFSSTEMARAGTIVLDRNINRQTSERPGDGDSRFIVDIQEGGSRVAHIEWVVPSAYICSFF